MDIGFTDREVRNARYGGEVCPSHERFGDAGGGGATLPLVRKAAVAPQQREQPRALKRAMMQELLTD